MIIIKLIKKNKIKIQKLQFNKIIIHNKNSKIIKVKIKDFISLINKI